MLPALICVLLIASPCFAQQESILQTQNAKSKMINDSQYSSQKPDVLSGGFLDIIQTGQINAHQHACCGYL